ncbi:Increased rDNA silencing protein [Friedmanniomyces endolithicus]|nr:Increased rDNA silencing protein [Friedmanniomyces endolithicus]KAK0792577.1 Increased rDNA silencing protein [Friedmanniomyces endolithicus]KAK0866185.1 Increased rDNA silencing protein [Friedmanniomyces endolithicus]KAK0925965.1 Increased rDNA silencing protein [Friedmanniomyces endolithicus]
MPGQRSSSRTPSIASINTTDSQSAALLGATKAFASNKPATPQRSVPSTTYSGSNGALAAATRVGTTPSPKHGAAFVSTDGGYNGTDEISTLEHSGTPRLAAPKRHDRGTSPSHQAAQLAVTRSPDTTAPRLKSRTRADTTHKPYVAPKPRRLSGHDSKINDRNPDRPTDLTPIRPTTSLVKLFEQKTSTSTLPHVRDRLAPVTILPNYDPPVRTSKPAREGVITTVFHMELPENEAVPRRATNIAASDREPVRRPSDDDERSSSDDYVSASEDTAPPSSSLTIRKRESRAPSVDPITINTGNRRPRPSPSPLRHSSTQPLQIYKAPSRNLTSPANMSVSSQSERSIPAQYNMLHPRRMTPLNTGNDLANAIVASSLASSRAPSPRKVDPPPVPFRNPRHHKLGFSRTPSPSKHVGMRHTLRKEESEETETENEDHPYGKHKKKRIVRKHPNKHHEGDRKRWREAVTERERKRYEGVWAANKGIHCSSTAEEEQHLQYVANAENSRPKRAAASELVSNIVTRDIWARSRLPDSVLEAVWDLVDSEDNGHLSKEEFVIDQRLKGRKLPVSVSGSVAQSVKGIQGIKIRKQ